MGNLLYKRRVLAFAQETTAGTPVTLTGTNGLFCFDPVIQGEIPMHDRNATGSLSKLPSVPGARKGKITFSCEIKGGGSSVPPAWAGLLLGCGMTAASNVYTFTSNPANYQTLTLGLYESGRYKVLSGCMGTFSIEGTYGQQAMIKFEFEGIWQAPTDATYIALPSDAAVTPPRVAAATFTLGSFTPKISKFSFEAGNVMKMIEDITTVSAYNRCIVTDRSVKGKLDPAGELIGTWDCYGQWIAGTTAALSLAVGTVTDNTITIAAPYVQIANIQEAQREQLVTDDIDFICAGTYAGDNELSISFS